MHQPVQFSLVNRTEALLFEILKSGPDKSVEATFPLGLQCEVQA